jgi:TRAP-type C4-dicarboxylate transport system substrate-binding protein
MKRRLSSARLIVVTLLVCSVALSACRSSEAEKSGFRVDPMALVLANNDGSLDGLPAVQHFLDRVSDLSGGRLTITVKSSWSGTRYDEPGLVRDVAAGRADLGLVGTRALDLAGVQAFRPLHAPFLVTSLAAEAAIIKDPLSKSLLDSLSPVGVTGLALMADEIRHPVGVSKPLLHPEDFKGIIFQTFPSGAQEEAIRALGATPTSDAIQVMVDQHALGGFETMWWTLAAHSYAEIAPYVSANVGLWPRTTVLVANPASLSRLDAQARGWIMTAAADASDWSTVHALDDQDSQITQACQQHARVALASPAELTALRTAAESVYASLRSDPAQRHTLERIEQLVASVPADAAITLPDGCAYQPGEETPAANSKTALLTVPGDPGSLPQGIYRYSTTRDFLLKAGLSDNDALINAGVFTWTLKNGRWHSKQQPIDPSVDKLDCDGYYNVQGSKVYFIRVTVYADGDCAPYEWTASWTATSDTLTWSDISLGDFQVAWAPRPWKKVG